MHADPFVPDHGLLIVNKPGGITSREVVDRAQRWFPGQRIGHAGTLDPLATGVMVLALGKATRLIEYVQEMEKTYWAVLRLGAVSDTDDAQGAISVVNVSQSPGADQVADVVRRFVGWIEQVPPACSAVHVEGERAYRRMRRGQAIALPPRRVRIFRIEILQYRFPWLEVVVDCGKGTYIRALARDLGQALGCGALVQKLERRRVGPFCIEEALGLEADSEQARAALRSPLEALAGLPQVIVPAEEMARLSRGQAVPGVASPVSCPAGRCAVLAPGSATLVIAQWDAARNRLLPAKVFEGLLGGFVPKGR
jgi:tRNA pseudouridine55 synthase